MRTVRMNYHVTGGRADGSDWPHMGETLTTEDGEAAELVAAGLADWADAQVVAAPAPPPPTEPVIGGTEEPPADEPPAADEPPVADEQQAADEPPADPPLVEDAAPGGSPASPPPVRAPRADWAAHAVGLGLAPADVDEMTKAQLIARFGNN